MILVGVAGRTDHASQFIAATASRLSAAAIVLKAAGSATVATATSATVLALLAKAEGKGAAQPPNATSHWLYGDRAATYRKADIDHTIIGLGTHTAATVFWAVAFETALAIRPARTPTSLLNRAGCIGALAALVDYTVTPERFTPDWELVLSKRAIALVYMAMAGGVCGGSIAQAKRMTRKIDVTERPEVPWLSVLFGYGPMLPFGASAAAAWVYTGRSRARGGDHARRDLGGVDPGVPCRCAARPELPY